MTRALFHKMQHRISIDRILVVLLQNTDHKSKILFQTILDKFDDNFMWWIPIHIANWMNIYKSLPWSIVSFKSATLIFLKSGVYSANISKATNTIAVNCYMAETDCNPGGNLQINFIPKCFSLSSLSTGKVSFFLPRSFWSTGRKFPSA